MDTIVALHRNHNREIISFQTSSGRIISYRKAIQEIKDGLIDEVTLDINVDGELSLSPASELTFESFPQIN